MTRFSIPMPLKWSSSTAESRSTLLPQLVRAPRLASNFHVRYDTAERKIYQSAGKIVIYNFWSITRNITRSVIIAVSCWFIGVFEEPGFLLIRGSLVKLRLRLCLIISSYCTFYYTAAGLRLIEILSIIWMCIQINYLMNNTNLSE